MSIPLNEARTSEHELFMRLAQAAFVLLVLSGCTFGVTQADVSVSSESTAAFDTFTFDARAPALADTTLVLRGDEGLGARTVAHVVGLVTSNSDELRTAITLPYVLQGRSLALDVQITGPRADSMWIETLTTQLPRTSNVLVTSPNVNVDIDAIDGALTVQGARDILIRHGNEVALSTEVGNIDVHARSGSLVTEVGNIALALDAPLTGGFELSARVGEVTIARAASVGFVLLVESEQCELDVEGRVATVYGRSEQTIGAGGPTIHVTSTQRIRIRIQG